MKDETTGGYVAQDQNEGGVVEYWLNWIANGSAASGKTFDKSPDDSQRHPRAFDFTHFDADQLAELGLAFLTHTERIEQLIASDTTAPKPTNFAIKKSPTASSLRSETVLKLFVKAIQNQVIEAAGEEGDTERLLVETATTIYEHWYGRLLGPTAATAIEAIEGPLLQCLSWGRRPEDLERLASLLVSKPPTMWMSTAIAISPLMRRGPWKVEAVFPKLIEGLQHASTAAPVLDLANYCVHSKRVVIHPAKSKEASMVRLLSGVVSRLSQAEEDPTKLGDSPEQIQDVLQDSIALAIALCDAVGLMESKESIGKLHQAIELQHRRVQTEAAAALARLGEETGRKALVRLAEEPIARLRVLQYAEELGIENLIAEEFTLPVAVAESQLALWLAEPQQFGIPPHSLELLDVRTLVWPSFDEPQQCYLFRYAFRLPQGEISNIGIAGPLTHTFACDLADLPIQDIYAMFAGWHAEHEEIFEVPYDQWNSAQKRVAKQLIDILEDQNHESIEPLWLGFFLGEITLVAQTHVGMATGFAVTDGTELLWYPNAGRLRPLGVNEVYSIYKGRKILRSFNSSDVFDIEEENS